MKMSNIPQPQDSQCENTVRRNISTDGCTLSGPAERLIISTESKRERQRECEGWLWGSPLNDNDNDDISLSTNTRKQMQNPLDFIMMCKYPCQFLLKNPKYFGLLPKVPVHLHAQCWGCVLVTSFRV